jgi:hypothetical protein
VPGEVGGLFSVYGERVFHIDAAGNGTQLVHVVAPNGDVWFLGTGQWDNLGDRFIYRFSGGQLSSQPLGGAVSLGVADGTVWQLNAGNFIYRWDGSVWTLKSSPAPAQSGGPSVVFQPNWAGETETAGDQNLGMISPHVYLIFSGSYWSTHQGDHDAVVAATQRILSGPYLSGLTQYGSDGKAIFNPATDTWQTDKVFTSEPQSPDLLTFLQGAITNDRDPGANDLRHAPIYVVVSDPTLTWAGATKKGFNDNGVYQGYPASVAQVGQPAITFPTPENINMIWLRSSAKDNTFNPDNVTKTLSHELAERMSDPTDNLLLNAPPSFPNPDNELYQVGDGEPDGTYNYRLNGDLVQPYWSNNDTAFIVPGAGVQTLKLTPNWSDGTNADSKFSRNYNLAVQAPANGQVVIDQIVDRSGDLKLSVTVKGEVALFDASAIKRITITLGDGGTIFVKAKAAGVSLSLDTQSIMVTGLTFSDGSRVYVSESGSIF